MTLARPSRGIRHVLAGLLSLFIGVRAFGELHLFTQYIFPSTGAVQLGEWNQDFVKALEIADSQHIPMLVFYAGTSCGACEALQLQCISDEFVQWQKRKKLLMVFVMDSTKSQYRGKSLSFTKPADGGDVGFPRMAVYWNRYGTVPEKHSRYYACFRGISGNMLAKSGSLVQQLIGSVEAVAGEYPYAGGEFLLPAGERTRLEVEAGYAAGTQVVVPLTRSLSSPYVNKLVCGAETQNVEWAEGELTKFVTVTLPAGLPEGSSVPLRLLQADDGEFAVSEIAVVAPRANSSRNPAWLGEPYSAGEWTMDIDNALTRASNGEFNHVLLFFTGALWCPHCQGLEDGVLSKPEFRTWCVDNGIALVELDNPRRSSSSVETDYAIHEASGAAPTLLRYAPGQNSYANCQESGASYLTRKGIDVGDANSPGSAEWVLQRNRRLGYAWGDGTYCAPDGGRTGYPTLILLEPDGQVAGRLNRLEGNGYVHDQSENMARLEELLKLAGGAGESANFPQTTTRELRLGGEGATIDMQVNDRVEYFRIQGVSAGRAIFTAGTVPEGNAAVLSIVSLADGVQSTLATGTGAVSVDLSGAETSLSLRVEAFAESKAYGVDSGFSMVVSSTFLLMPSEKTQSYTPGIAGFSLSLRKGCRYRLQGFTAFDPEVLRDEGEAVDGGRYYVALSSGDFVVGAADTTVSYQLWVPGTVSFSSESQTVFRFQGAGTMQISRRNGSSGSVAVKVQVVGGDAENGVRYRWNDATVLTWEDGEVGEKSVSYPLLDTGSMLPNQDFVLQMVDATGSAAEGVSSRTCTVTISDTDKPTLSRWDYEIPMFATFDAAGAMDAQTVYNVNAGKIVVKKVSGALPSGVKLVCENGRVALSGSAKKPGTYSYTFTLQQKKGGELEIGPEITMTFVVADAVGGNSMMDKALKATLPLYETEGDKLVVKGVLNFSTTAKNRIFAKYVGLSRKKISFKGIWRSAQEGTARAEFSAKTGQTLHLALDQAGRLRAEFLDPDNGPGFSSGDGLRVGVDSFASVFSGYYTVSLVEAMADDPAGHGYLIVKSIGSDGKAKWSGMLANGVSVSGTSHVMLDEGGCAVLPVFVYRPKDYLSGVFRIRANGGTLYLPRAVKEVEGTTVRYSHYVPPSSTHDCIARGSWYDKQSALDDCCYLQFGGKELHLSAQTVGFSSELYGSDVSTPSGDVLVLPDALRLTEKDPDLKLTFSNSKGVFGGSMKLLFGARRVSAKFKGVVVPGWHDCHCEVPNPEDPFAIDLSQPFAVGALWFSDKVGGKAVKRGFAVKIDEKGM